MFNSRELKARDRPGRNRMIIGFTTICAINAYHYSSFEFEPRSWRGVLDTIIVSDFRQVCGFLRVFTPPPIKLIAPL